MRNRENRRIILQELGRFLCFSWAVCNEEYYLFLQYAAVTV